LNSAPADDVLRSLHAVRRRILAQAFFATFGRAALVLGGALVMAGVVRRFALNVSPWSALLTLWGGALILALSFVITWWRRPTLAQTATAIDRLGSTHDRFVTALDFSDEANAPSLRALAVRECTKFIRGGDFARLVRLRVPRELPYLVVPALALALMNWEARGTLGARAEEKNAAQAEVEGTAKSLEELARQMEKENEEKKTEDLKKLAEELKRSARQLRAEATTSEDAEKASLRELSQLEKLVQEMQKQPGTPTSAELRELAKALEKQDQTKEAAASMNAGDLAKAAEQLEKAMKDLEDAGDEATKEQIDQALKEAMERLAEQKQLSEALEKLAKQMQSNSGEDGKNGQQISKELADLLKKLQPQAGPPKQGGKPLSEQALKNLLAALQNLKFGEGQPNPGGEPQPGQPPGTISMQNFGKNAPPGEGGDPRMPSGSPGSEHDTGTTETPFGKEQNPAGENGQQQSVAGRLGQGETLQQFLPGIADASKSKRRYKELYEAMAPAAEDAVVQENIPLGSRFFIKRYFESIRPRE
jgi:tetratricopeptide (TPR) repeat protein